MSDDLFALASELNIDLGTVEVEKDKVVEEKKIEKPKRKRTTKANKKDDTSIASADDVKEKKTKQSKRSKKEEPTSVKEKPEKTKYDKRSVFTDWNGFKVNYLGKPMKEEGKFITLDKRYNSKKQEKFRDVNGRMVLVIHEDKDGKVKEVHVYKETPDGQREEVPTAYTLTNKYRMENRCREFARLLDLAYDRKRDIEIIKVG